ncbi:xanthine dehydrogenase small subunit [Terrarubrum flagellatum]|uniref:xanthine dehydrogenase small subunit n=1 Tax=Terrirubrum flagellatum TaxID=2895980 RepID=UPI00314545E3
MPAMRRTIRFLLGSEAREVSSCDPTATLLDWLRGEARLRGTKEGCAEGDCGACTVVIGRLEGGQLRYEAINSCIRFLGTLDGCHLVTVEHLKRPDGTLHPVQQAMVDHHGSQCGFCTPGIVMSLFALWLNEDRPSDTRIEDALAGNLCRCTGYEPILSAARGMYDLGARAEDLMVKRSAEITATLTKWRDDSTVEMASGERRFLAPATADELARLIAHEPKATVLAGGTDVGLWVTKEMRDIAPLIYLGRVDALKKIEDVGDALIFGAGVNHIDVRKALGKLHPHLDELMRRFGGEQIRNAGTIGGNIANGSPIGDLPPALIALGASITLRRGAGRRVIPLEQYFIAYKKQDRKDGEFLQSITVPKPPRDALIHISKISKRFDEDISSVCGAFLLRRAADGTIAQARLVYGGMAATPKRAHNAETILKGRAWDESAVASAIGCLAVDFKPLDDMRASARYRAMVAGALLRRFLIETTEPDVKLRVAGPLAGAVHG